MWCSQGPSESRWQTGSEPGTVLACNEPFGRLSMCGRQTRVLKGVLEIPRDDDRCIAVSPACVAHDRCECVTSRAVADRSFEA